MTGTIPLGKVIDVSAGQPAPKANEFSDEGTPFIRAGSLESLLNGKSEDDCEKVADAIARKNRLRLYPANTILFAKSGMSAKIGRVYRLRQPAYVVSHLAALAPTNKYDANYLAYWLRRNPPSHLIKDDSYPSIRTSEIAALEVPNVHVDEQRRVAAVLDKAEAIRRKREQALALADDFLKSVFLEMFGDPKINPYGFAKEKIKKHLSKVRAGTQSGPFGAALKKSEYVEGGIPVWGVENVQHNEFIERPKLFITEDKFEQLKRYQVLSGDILISRAGTVGRMCIANTEAKRSIISTNLVRVALDLKALLPEYFVSLFTYVPTRLGALKANNKDEAFTFLNPKTLREIEIPIPDMDIQERYAEIVRSVEASKRDQAQHLDGLTALFSSLSQRAFSGEL